MSSLFLLLFFNLWTAPKHKSVDPKILRKSQHYRGKWKDNISIVSQYRICFVKLLKKIARRENIASNLCITDKNRRAYIYKQCKYNVREFFSLYCFQYTGPNGHSFHSKITQSEELFNIKILTHPCIQASLTLKGPLTIYIWKIYIYLTDPV